jgi:chromosome segregation ATPase
MLLSKALKMQQDLEDKKHEVIIEGLESKIKDHVAALEKKDFELQTVEGLLAEAEAKIAKLNNELLSKLESFEQEKQKFDAKFEAEVEKSSNLQKSLKELQDKCLDFGNRCVQRLLGRRQRRYPSLDAFANLAAPTETRRLADSTLRPTRRRTKAYGEVAPSRGHVQHEGPCAILPIVTGPVWPLRITGLICKGFSVITVRNPAL